MVRIKQNNIKKTVLKTHIAKSSIKLPGKAKKILIGGSVGVAGVVVVIGLVYTLAVVTYAHKIYPNVQVGLVNVGGLTLDQAKTKLDQAFSDFSQKKLIISSSTGKTWTVEPNKLGFKPDSAAQAQKALEVGHNTNPFQGILDLGQLVITPIILPVDKAGNQDGLKQFIETVAKDIDIPQSNATLSFVNGSLTEKETKTGLVVDKDSLAMSLNYRLSHLDTSTIGLIMSSQEPIVYPEGLVKAKAQTETMLGSGIELIYQDKKFVVDKNLIGSWLVFHPGAQKVEKGRGVYLEVSLNEDKLKKFAVDVAKAVDQPARNAQLEVKDGKVAIFLASSEGLTVDKNRLVEIINQAAINGQTGSVALPVTVVKPEVSESSITNLGIKELIGSGTTSFARSPQNRIYNINLGAKYLNGKLIKPGDTFSTIGELGVIDESTGYRPELVIKDNKTTPEFGGGLCQVSTTLFRATLDAGLPIVERQNHSWRISYYEPPVGLDATIYFPKPDFKFKNDTANWILVQNKIEGTKITFELYGTKDGRVAKIEGPTLLYSKSPGESVYVDDPSLPAGTTKQIQSPHPGGSAVASYRVVDKDGKVINEQTFKSVYKAVPAQFTRGTVPAPTPEPTPAPEPAPVPEPTPTPTTTTDTTTPTTEVAPTT